MTDAAGPPEGSVSRSAPMPMLFPSLLPMSQGVDCGVGWLQPARNAVTMSMPDATVRARMLKH